MDKFPGKLLFLILAAFLLAFGIFIAYSIQTFPEKSVLRFFHWSWVVNNGFRLLIQTMPALQITAILAACSLFFPRGKVRIPGEFMTVIGKMMILFLLLTMVYTAAVEGFLPPLLQRQRDREYRTAMARDFKTRAERARAAGDLVEAQSLYRNYLLIHPDDAAIVNEEISITNRIRSRNQIPDMPMQESIPARKNIDLSGIDYYRKAQDFYDREDYFSAHYYAVMSYRVDRNMTVSGKRLADLAWQKIVSETPLREETERYDFFSKKMEGHSYLTREDTRPIEAYYIFSELLEENSGDPDVREFLNLSTEKMRELTYFIDEAESASSLPGINTIIYIESSDSEPIIKNLVHIDKMIFSPEGIFFRDLERILFDRNGNILEHFSAPFGKYHDGHILLHGVDRDIQGKEITPVFHAGLPGGGSGQWPGGDAGRAAGTDSGTNPGNNPDIFREGKIPYQLHMAPRIGEMAALSHAEKGLDHLVLNDLITYSRLMNRYGFRREPAQAALLTRLTKPFLFLILSFLAVGIGIALRPVNRGIPLFLLPTVLFFPFLVHNLLEILYYGEKVLAGFLLLMFGFIPAAAILMLIHGIFLFITLIILAGQQQS